MVHLLLWALVAGSTFAEGAKILMFFNAVSRSHHILGEALGIGLADKGHEVTMVTPFKADIDHPKFKQIILDGLVEYSQNTIYSFSKRDLSTFEMFTYAFDVRNSLANYTMNHREIKKLVDSKHTFDVFITELNLNECIFGFGHYYNAIPIVFSTIGSNIWADALAGLTFNPALERTFAVNYQLPMKYHERLVNTLAQIGFSVLNWYRFNKQEALYEEFFKPLYDKRAVKLPSLHALQRNFSLILLNNNIATTVPSPQLPHMINVGGLHIKPKKLPKDLQNIMDNATEGVIYFSLGGNLQSSKIPEQRLHAILTSLGKLKQIVLWKCDEKLIPNKPNNVIVREWLPQQDVLAHKNTVAFISHGGMLSKLEALYFGIPMIGIPILGDQFMNVAQAVDEGYAIGIELNNITEDNFSKSLNTIIYDSRYTKRARELSAIFRDNTQTALERAVSGVEYVLRYKGAPFLRPPTMDVPLYQKLLIDVMFGLVTGLTVIISLLYFLIKQLYRAYVNLFYKFNKSKKID